MNKTAEHFSILNFVQNVILEKENDNDRNPT